ncbi:acyl-CoA dehydrogenase [Fodinicurvata sediminis]|uniref:acyl-CoA dehydrogenase n=1 Tax=Fodinicurvata sediminis TaxID=1121832 RepID=UPI0003B6D8FD|nr:acyl-CoA dehydrogenase [Fodinicurvata sediminis]
MTEFDPPLQDMRFTLDAIAGVDRLLDLPVFRDVSQDLIASILDEAGRLARDVMAPVNQSGDIQGTSLHNGQVSTPEGYCAAYRRYVEGNWNSLPFDPKHGGQGLPWLLAIAIQELFSSANMSLGLCPLLTQSAIELIQSHGSDDQKRVFLPPLISGDWTAAMTITEPQAGSDVGAIRTRAVRDEHGYRLFGQKIFVTYGDHDLSENILHMVLARTDEAPAGSKGLSLFIVPKWLPREDGTPGERNDVQCTALEHKLGIHGSPTCAMTYGDREGAIAHLVGEENRGMEYMFTMMNTARLGIGAQGVGIAERAYQQARRFAFERIQGRRTDQSAGSPVAIIHHPDVRRMLMTMKATTEAARALVYYTATAIDLSRNLPDRAARDESRINTLELLTPVAKAWASDAGCHVASLGIQVHGGMGYVEETGAAQHFRDARIAPIYEGTNGIQAHDLIKRKIMHHKGQPAWAFLQKVRATTKIMERERGEDLNVIRRSLEEACEAFEQATEWLIETWDERPLEASAGATPYLNLLGTLAGGWLLAEGARKSAAICAGNDAEDSENSYYFSKLRTARFFADNILPASEAYAAAAIRGSAAITDIPEDYFC